MRKCKKCEWEFPDDMRECPYCGHPVEPEDKKQKRRFKLRWHPNTLPPAVQRPPSGLAPSKKHLQFVLLVSAIIAALVLTGVLWARAVLISTPHPDQPLIVNPSLLDFGQVEVGRKSVLSVIIKKSNGSHLNWHIDPANAQWLQIALRPHVTTSSNPGEDIYDVTATTSKLHVGKYSALLRVSSESGSTQRVPVKIQVISNSTPPPAKLTVNPLLLDFGSQNVGIQKTQLLTVSNSGGQELRWSVDKGNAPWLTLDQSSGKIAAGAIPQSINVKVDTTALTAGHYSTTINFSSNGGNAPVGVILYVVAPPPPTTKPEVLSVSPNSGSTSGGTRVTIKGTGFTGATKVSFDSTAAKYTVDSDTQITAVSPAGSCTVDVTVTTPTGTSARSSADQFTYIPPTPLVTNIDPTSGPSTGGTAVTITGTGFTCATGVSFGSTAETNFNIVNDTQITINSPAGSGTVDVKVTTPGGTSAPGSSDDQFTYIPFPSVSEVSPARGGSLGGNKVTITGTGFTDATSVSIGTITIAAANFSAHSATQITIENPGDSNPALAECAATPTNKDCMDIVHVTVTTPGGTSVPSAADQFTFYYQPPIQ